MDFETLLKQWEVDLRSESKSPETIKSYTRGVRSLLRWCAAEGRPPALDRATVITYTASLLDRGAESTTARTWQYGIRRFSHWLAEVGEIDHDELSGLRPPALDEKVVDRLSDAQCSALIKACQGKAFRDRRDEAIARLMAETPLRAGDVIGMTVPDTDTTDGIAVIRRGKGGKGRTVPFSLQSSKAINAYLRARVRHPRAFDTDALWLGDRGRGPLAYAGLATALGNRATAAGITGFHLHKLRHTAAQRWLDAGGSEGGLMSIGGWSNRQLLDRYTKATHAERAARESRDLGLGNL